MLDILPAEDGLVAESTGVDSIAARRLTVETLPACADMPLWPAMLPPPGNPCLFSSA
jgi:hypothetical protein